MYINDIFRFVNTLKNQSQGRGLSAKEFEDYLNNASLSLWRREVKRVESNLQSNGYLKNFEFESNVKALTDTLNVEYGHYTGFELVKYIDPQAETKEIDFIRTPDLLDDHYFSLRKNEGLYPPTEDYPIMKLVGNSVIAYPITFDGYIVTGYSYPTKSVYATTISTDGRDYVFDEANSVDIDWPEIAHGELIALVCKGMGITLKDDWLVQYETIQRQSEAA